MSNVSEKRGLLGKILNVVLILLTVATIATPLIGTMYTFLSEDDFGYESGGVEGAAQFQSSLVGSFYKTLNIYKEQQGCYTPMFLDHLIRPYSRFGLPGFHVAMFTYVAVFILSLVFVSFILAKEKTPSLAVLLVALLSVFTMSETNLDTDIMFWHTETLGFTLMLGFLFLALGFSILDVRSKGGPSVLHIVLGAIFAFLASGASLTVVAVNCAALLAVLILDFEKVKERKILVIPFVSGFIGALINAVAPGNFVRSGDSAVPGHETLLDGFRDTFSCLFKAYPKAIDLVFILCALFVLAICILYKVEVLDGGISGIRMIIVVAGVFLLQYFEVFTAAYGGHVAELSKHLAIEHYIMTRLTVLFVVMCLAQFIREHFKAVENLEVALKTVCAVAVVLVLVLPASRAIIKDSFTARTFRDFKSGTMTRIYTIRQYELATFELAEDGSDCIIYQPWDISSESMTHMGISADSEWIVNRSAASLFGLNTTTVLVP